MATAPKPPTTPTTIDWVGTVYGSGFTPTTVARQPKASTTTTTTTTIPPLSDDLEGQILSKQASLYGTKYSSKEIEKAKPDLPWYKDVALGALDTFIVKPLKNAYLIFLLEFNINIGTIYLF